MLDGATLEVTGLTCRRGGRTVLRDLGFSVPNGKAALVRGPNGAGKSTLLRVLAGLLAFQDGVARMDGLSLGSDAAAWQERVAYAGHLDAVKPALSVRVNLEVWARVLGGAGVDAALERLGLTTIADRAAGECSAGQRRRLGLARLLLTERPLWLLDEPTVSLDDDTSVKVATMVRDHCARGGIALVASHIGMDLGDGPVIEIASPGPAPGTDPFLDGDWA
ncbi:MAG: heme ABC exporter ATP-binding protein CcmA [Pseudomonadota bacterium]